MVRHPRPLSLVALAAIVSALAGCGIKGPLTLPPAEAAKAPDAAKPAARDPRSEPRL